MAPLLNTLISRIVLGQTKKRRPGLPRPASITFSEGDFPGGHQQYGDYPSQSSSLGNSPMRGAPEDGSYGNSLAQGSPSQPLRLSNSPIDSQTQQQFAAFAARSTQNVAAQGNTGTAPETEEQDSFKGKQQGRDAVNAPLQTGSLQYQTSSAGVDTAPSTSDADNSSSGHAHGYNGTRDRSGAAAAAPSSNASDSDLQSAINNNSTASLVQTHDVGTHSSDPPPSNRAVQSHAAERSAADQDSFVELVQGTEQLLGMLGARDVS